MSKATPAPIPSKFPQSFTLYHNMTKCTSPLTTSSHISFISVSKHITNQTQSPDNLKILIQTHSVKIKRSGKVRKMGLVVANTLRFRTWKRKVFYWKDVKCGDCGKGVGRLRVGSRKHNTIQFFTTSTLFHKRFAIRLSSDISGSLKSTVDFSIFFARTQKNNALSLAKHAHPLPSALGRDRDLRWEYADVQDMYADMEDGFLGRVHGKKCKGVKFIGGLPLSGKRVWRNGAAIGLGGDWEWESEGDGVEYTNEDTPIMKEEDESAGNSDEDIPKKQHTLLPPPAEDWEDFDSSEDEGGKYIGDDEDDLWLI